MMELHPDWVIVKLDLRNAYNEVTRAKILERLERHQTLRALAPLFRACYAGTPSIYLAAEGLVQADFKSEEGVQQGDGLASAEFCVAIHDEMVALDSLLQRHGHVPLTHGHDVDDPLRLLSIWTWRKANLSSMASSSFSSSQVLKLPA